MSDQFDTYIAQGKSLGLSGTELVQYCENCEERNRRYEEKQKEREREREEKEREREREEKEREREREERERQMELERFRIEKEAAIKEAELELEVAKVKSPPTQTKDAGSQPRVSNYPKLPTFKEATDSIDAFLYRFEAHATALKWNTDHWPVLLSAILDGQALSLYHGLCSTGPVDYQTLKDCLLAKFQCTAEGCREKFRACKPEQGEGFKSFGTRLAHLLNRWLELADCPKTFDALYDMLLCEQMFACVSKDLAVFLRERKLTKFDAILEAAECYRLAHPSKLLGRRTDPPLVSNSAVPVSNKSQSHPGGPKGRGGGFHPGLRQSVPNQVGRGCGSFGRGFSSTWGNQPFRGANSSRGSGSFRGRGSSQSIDNIDCWRCGGRGHLAVSCPSFKQAEQSQSTGSNTQAQRSGSNLKIGQAAVLCSAVDDSLDLSDLDLSKGVVNGVKVTVMRDDGATTAGVKRDLVLPHQFTGSKQWVKCFGHLDSYDVATVDVQSPYFTGQLDCCVMDDPVVDIIIGRIKGKTVPGVSKNFVPGLVGNIQAASVAVTRSMARKEEALPKPLKGVNCPVSFSEQDLLKCQKADLSLQKLFHRADSREVCHFGGDSWIYLVIDGVLYRRFFQGSSDCRGDYVDQMVVPVALRKTVLQFAHDGLLAGHCGSKRTLWKVRQRFFWPGLSKDVKSYCRSCDVCQRAEPAGRVRCVPLQFMPRIEEPFHRVAVDIVGPISPPSEDNHRYILTIIDVATRFPEAVPLRKIDSVSVSEALLTVFSRVGFPVEILSDQGTQFTSDMMKAFHRLLAVKGVHSSVYHAQSNGVVERFHGTLKPMLKKLMQSQPRLWHRYLPALLFACRECPNASTGFSPFELLFGRRPRGPLELLANVWSGKSVDAETKTVFQHLVDMKSMISDMLKLAHDSVDLARVKQKFYHDRKAVSRSFRVGDEVLVFSPTTSGKLKLQWMGPFVIMEKVGMDYRVDLGRSSKVYHPNMLKPYHRRQQDSQVESRVQFADILNPDYFVQDGGDITTQDDSQGSSFGSDDSVAVANVAVVPSNQDVHELPEICPVEASSKENISDVHFDANLDKSCATELKRVFEDFQDILCAEPGAYNGPVLCEVKLTSDVPVRQKQYPLPFASKQVIVDEVHKMLDLGVIEPSDSPYASPIVLVSKPDGSVRFCQDFRALNKITVFDAEPIPDPEELFTSLSDKHFFTKIDLSKGYWQLFVKPEDRYKTAFQTPLGLFQWVRMPFGLVSAPAAFARMMRQVIGDSAINFFDDVLIANSSWKGHLTSVRAVLTKLKNAGLTARPSKIFAGFQELEFLGHVVGSGQRKPVPAKVSKILSVATPTTKRQVRSLLGLISYYRRYVPNFAALTSPISDLLAGKSRKFVWSQVCADALRQIQEVLSSSPVLLLPDLSLPFVVRTDASSTGIGGVLLQEKDDHLHPICFVSRKLLDRETRYSTIERECLAIVWVLCKLQRYLWGQSFVLQTDHRPLAYLRSGRFQNSRIMRWALALQEFCFSVEPVAGEQNCFADLLSRSGSDQVVFP